MRSLSQGSLGASGLIRRTFFIIFRQSRIRSIRIKKARKSLPDEVTTRFSAVFYQSGCKDVGTESGRCSAYS